MTETRVFAEKGRVKLVGDSRDVAVPVEHRDAVWKWCEDSGITLEYQGTLNWVDLWRVRDQKQRAAFLLKWSGHV